MARTNFFQIILFLVAGLLLWAAPVAAQSPGALVLGMAKEEGVGAVRITLHLSARTTPQVAISGQRVDLTLSNAALGTNVQGLPEDASLIRVLFINRRGDLVVSHLFRRPPARAEAVYDRGRNQVVLEVFWDEADAARRTAIAPRLGGSLMVQADGATGQRKRHSRYAGDWRRFFADYETPLRFELQPLYSLPALEALAPLEPNAAGEFTATLNAALELGHGGDWRGALEILRQVPNAALKGAAREQFELLTGEALARTGAMQEARRRLKELVEGRAGVVLEARARYLAAYAQAAGGDPHGALFQLSQARMVLAEDDPLAARVGLLEAEIQLGMGRDAQALVLLESLSLEGGTDDLRRLARAAALSGVGRHEEALELFEALQARYGELRHAFAVERLARSHYALQRFAEAAQAYASLAGLSAGEPAQGLAVFAQAQANWRSGDAREARILLDRVLVAFPDSQGGPRATLKLIDLAVIRGEDKSLVWAIMDYGRLAEEAPERGLREEAAFKQALALHLGHDNRRSVTVLEQFIRNYFSGTLRGEAEALLGELLPPVIDELIAAEEYLQALVLVERHREILLDHRIDWDFLKRLAGAFRDMELLGRAARVYLFMLDNNREPGREQGLYLPLVRVLLERGQYESVREYARRYAREYPRGADRAEVLLIEARALKVAGRREEAAALLSAPERPAGVELDRLGGQLNFQLGRYPQAIDCLKRLVAQPAGVFSAEEHLLLAEALYRAARHAEALEHFEALRTQAQTADQAAYRCAQIHLHQGDRVLALKLLRQLVDEGSSDLWRRLGQEKIAVLAL
ncbi:tetratricopeptide repeat protein [Geoalkalibacter halelectricus]|uniref:Tetratricopeptide repeat protein n=1 Tax=Geoalkalibacter halelectricus TaxID=2847045 RepID=A0ABY5ZK78_9BACT|nr:tetratricopeptide repeat protein [Geoalkalibacter halelectricus]MDO3378085.1 tetratricopeptide repeat protein [Geoalkalibacter halelectricus]UWZ78382.1 tetratricopeptide repeat protein [Geoalkalibacter halelectricus]